MNQLKKYFPKLSFSASFSDELSIDELSIDEFVTDEMIIDTSKEFFLIVKKNNDTKIREINDQDISFSIFNFLVEKFGIDKVIVKIFEEYDICDIIDWNDESIIYFFDKIIEMKVNLNYQFDNNFNIGEHIINNFKFNCRGMVTAVNYLNNMKFDLRKMGKIILVNFYHFYKNDDEYHDKNVIWNIIVQQNFDEEDMKIFGTYALLDRNIIIVKKIIELKLLDASKCEEYLMNILPGACKLKKKSKNEKQFKKLGFDPKIIWFLNNLKRCFPKDEYDISWSFYLEELFEKKISCIH